MKNIRNIVTTFIITILLITPSFVNASHNEVSLTESNNLTIAREVTNVSNPVNTKFTYQIVQGLEVPASSDKAALNPSGGSSGMPTSTTVEFKDVSPVSGIAKMTGTIDLSHVKFTKVGDYTWTLIEKNSTDNNNYPIDSDSTYEIRVSVRYNNSGDMIASVAISDGTNKLSITSGDDTQILFSKSPTFTKVSIANAVQGNMADIDKYFKITVTINGPTGDIYNLSGLDASDVTYNGSNVSNPNTLTAGTPTVLYLKHNEKVTIGESGNNKQIPVGTEYTFVEGSEGKAANYLTYINGSTTNSKDSGSLTTIALNGIGTSNNKQNNSPINLRNKNENNPVKLATVQNNDNTIINKYDAATLTGVFIKITPYVIIIALVVFIATYMIYKSILKRNN